MRVFLDDDGSTPDGWIRVYWPSQAIDLLKTGAVLELSLDHDLGDDDRGTGYDVVRWIEEAVILREFRPPTVSVHSANPAARERMLAGIRSIERHRLDQSASEFSSRYDARAEPNAAARLRGLHPQLAEAALDIPMGWFGVVDDLLKAIDQRARVEGVDGTQVRFDQIKAKFAELRCHVKTPFEIDDLVKRAWLRSTLTCERCGAIGRLRMRRSLDNVRTTCDRCESKDPTIDRRIEDVAERTLPGLVQARFHQRSDGWIEVVAEFTSDSSGTAARTRSMVVHRDDVALSVAYLLNKEQATPQRAA